MHLISRLSCVAVIGTSLLFAGDALAQQPWQRGGDVGSHLDEVADDLRHATADLANDLRAKSRHNFAYRSLYREAVEMYRLADHVHDVAHHTRDLSHLHEDVDALDASFHRFEALAHRMTSFDRRHGGHWHHGHASHDTGLSRQLAEIEDLLHHLQEDIHDLQPVATPVVPRRGQGLGLNIGGLRIQF